MNTLQRLCSEFQKYVFLKSLRFVAIFGVLMLTTVTPWSSHFRQLLSLAIPVCLSNMGHIFVDLADNFFVGQLPERTPSQAAISLASGAYHFILVLLIGLSYGLTPIVAAASATNDKDKIKTHLRHSFLMNVVTAVGLFTVLAFCAPLLHYANKPADVTDRAIGFLNVIMFSMLPLSVFFTFKQFAEGMSDTRVAMYITIGANVLNIALNWALVFGNLGLPRMGMMGSCWATFIARCLMAVAMWLYIRRSPRYVAYRFRLLPGGWSWAIAREQLRIGIPAGLMFAMEVGAFSLPAFFIPGTVDLAAHRISLSLASMTYMISSGLSAAATIRTGYYLGLKELHNVRRAGLSAVLLAGLFMSLAALSFLVFNRSLPAIFNDEAAVISAASGLLLIGAAFQLFDGIQVTAQGALRGVQDAIVPGIIAFVAYWVVGLPASYLLCVPFALGAKGVWLGFILGLSVSSVGFLWRFRLQTRRPRLA